jgi:hypothetical protein
MGNIVMETLQTFRMKNKKTLPKLLSLNSSEKEELKATTVFEQSMTLRRRLKRAVYAVIALNRLKKPPITNIDQSVKSLYPSSLHPLFNPPY